MKLDAFHWTLIAVTIFFSALIIVLIHMSNKSADRANEYAQSIGCTYIGRARDLPGVRFFDCNGEIKMVRIQS